jgi:hypothetical protein
MLGLHSFDLRNVALIVGSLGANAAMAWCTKHLAIRERGIPRHEIRDAMIVFPAADFEPRAAAFTISTATGERFNSDTLGEFNALHSEYPPCRAAETCGGALRLHFAHGALHPIGDDSAGKVRGIAPGRRGFRHDPYERSSGQLCFP